MEPVVERWGWMKRPIRRRRSCEPNRQRQGPPNFKAPVSICRMKQRLKPMLGKISVLMHTIGHNHWMICTCSGGYEEREYQGTNVVERKTQFGRVAQPRFVMDGGVGGMLGQNGGMQANPLLMALMALNPLNAMMMMNRNVFGGMNRQLMPPALRRGAGFGFNRLRRRPPGPYGASSSYVNRRIRNPGTYDYSIVL